MSIPARSVRLDSFEIFDTAMSGSCRYRTSPVERNPAVVDVGRDDRNGGRGARISMESDLARCAVLRDGGRLRGGAVFASRSLARGAARVASIALAQADPVKSLQHKCAPLRQSSAGAAARG